MNSVKTVIFKCEDVNRWWGKNRKDTMALVWS